MKYSYANDYTNTTQAYISELDNSRYNTIPKEIEIDLLKKAKNGDKKALNQLVESNLRLVVSIAKRYKHLSLEMNDLIAEGNIGLLNAIERFDLRRNVRLCSYATWWINKAILLALKNRCEINNFETSVNNLAQHDEEEYEVEDIANINKTKQLDNIYEESDSYKETINFLLSKLDKRSREVIEYYYGLNDKDSLTMNEIGEKLNLSMERIRQIKSRAMITLRTSALASESVSYK